MKKIVHSAFIVLFLLAQVALATDVPPAKPTPQPVKKVTFVKNLLNNNLITRTFGKKNTAVQDDEKLYSSNKITISAIYPNPASTQAAINYELNDEVVRAKVVLCNVLGNIVGEYSLSRDAKKLIISTQDFASGVYFYTLNVDGKNVVNRRLIVKHN